MGFYDTPFWEAIQKRELRLQRCRDCGHVWYPPGPVCPQCLSETWSFDTMSGRASVVAWTVFHRQYFPEIPVPYLVASVELDEGPLMIGNVLRLQAHEMRLGLRLKAEFDPAMAKDGGEWLIVQWAPE